LIQGVSEDYVVMRDYKFKTGFNFNASDNQAMEKVAVLGATSAAKLFNDEDPIDKTVYINNIRFRVIGVLQTKGLESEMGNIDNVAIIPVRTFLRRVSNLDYLGQIYLSADEQDNCTGLESDMRAILRDNHKLDLLKKEDDFVIVNQLSSIKAVEETSKEFNILLIGVAGISVVIGGVGILAMMILSVKERIGEIGLRISVGAGKKDIIWQFLSESMLLGIAGGIVGIALGIIFSVLTNVLSNWSTIISWKAIAAPFSLSILTALIFGSIPACRAANLDPVEALRSE
jgi:ABC-type antimicrobial peptide transport system permease subunit